MRREKKQISIKWKIFGYLLCFTLVLILLLWLFQIVYLDSFYRTIKARDARTALTEIEQAMETGADDMEEQINEIAQTKDISVLVAGKDGDVLYYSDYMGAFRLDAMPAEERVAYYEEAKGQGGFLERQIAERWEGQKWGMAAQPPEEPQAMGHGKEGIGDVLYVKIAHINGQEKVIFLNTFLSPVEATVQTLQAQLGWITAILIVLSLVLATAISRHVSGSIIRVNESAKELAAGDYAVRFDGKDYREVAELSDTLNYAAKELEKTETLRRELIANVSHDLRTPLTMIIAYAEVMRDLPGENTPENVQVIIDESKHLTNLVNDMLDLSKLQAGAMERQDTRFSLTKSIESVLERYHKLKEQEGYRIDFLYEEDAYVEADEFKIGQVVYNLVNNAINYAGDDKCVTVRQITDKENVRIEVEDTGEGIDEENLPYVWDRYYKVDKTHKRSVSGTGLGLSIVKSILELHDAQYGVESELGKGTMFWFSLKRLSDRP